MLLISNSNTFYLPQGFSNQLMPVELSELHSGQGHGQPCVKHTSSITNMAIFTYTGFWGNHLPLGDKAKGTHPCSSRSHVYIAPCSCNHCFFYTDLIYHTWLLQVSLERAIVLHHWYSWSFTLPGSVYWPLCTHISWVVQIYCHLKPVASEVSHTYTLGLLACFSPHPLFTVAAW